MAKEKRATWFKMQLHQKAIIDAVSDAEAGQAIKAVFKYFDTGEVPDMTTPAFLVFASVKPDVDRALSDYAARVERGKESQL